MPYTVSIDDEQQFVEVVYSGSITVSTRVCAMEDGATLLESRRYRRVLVDLRAANHAPAPTEAGNTVANAMAQRPRVLDSRLAYLVSPTQQADMQVEHLVATRHAALQHFTEREDALEWLLLD